MKVSSIWIVCWTISCPMVICSLCIERLHIHPHWFLSLLLVQLTSIIVLTGRSMLGITQWKTGKVPFKEFIRCQEHSKEHYSQKNLRNTLGKWLLRHRQSSSSKMLGGLWEVEIQTTPASSRGQKTGAHISKERSEGRHTSARRGQKQTHISKKRSEGRARHT